MDSPASDQERESTIIPDSRSITMNAAFIDQYGPPSVLQVGRLARPFLAQPTDMLIAVHASCVNPADWKTCSGAAKSVLKYEFPLIPGMDFSGTVVQVGTAVTRFNIGDEVYGKQDEKRLGAYAEFMLADESDCALKPRKISHSDAASLPTVALTALQALTTYGQLQRGQSVLITGGAGGVGCIAIQVAKALGAGTIVTTCSAANTEFVKSLGADRVVDYRAVRVHEVVSNMDVVFHTVDANALPDLFACVKKGGHVVSIAASMPSAEAVKQVGANAAIQMACSAANMPNRFRAWKAGATYRYFFTDRSAKDLETLATMVDSGALKPIVAKMYPLEKISEAFEENAKGHTRGKLVILTQPLPPPPKHVSMSPVQPVKPEPAQPKD